MKAARMDPVPATKIAWMLLLIGGASLVFSLVMQLPMWLVELGLRPVSAGGSEYIVGLISGLPSLLVAMIFLAIATLPRVLRSQLAVALFVIGLLFCGAWLLLLAGDFWL